MPARSLPGGSRRRSGRWTTAGSLIVHDVDGRRAHVLHDAGRPPPGVDAAPCARNVMPSPCSPRSRSLRLGGNGWPGLRVDIRVNKMTFVLVLVRYRSLTERSAPQAPMVSASGRPG